MSVPAAVRDGHTHYPSLRHGRDEPPVVAGPHEKSGDAPPELHRRKRLPTARLPERGLRDSEDLRTPFLRPRHVVGERLATDKRQSSVNGAEKRSLHTAPLLINGEGEEAEGGLLPRGYTQDEPAMAGCYWLCPRARAYL